MKREVTFKCGHTDTVRLFETDEEVEQQATAMSEFCECPECAMKRFGDIPPISYEFSVEQSGKMGLPPLVGSFKQIKWANTIRVRLFAMTGNALRHLFELERKVLCSIPKYGNILQCLDFERLLPEFFWELFGESIAYQRDATWYIARQNHCARELINDRIAQICEEQIKRRNRSKQPESASTQDALAEIPKEDIIVLENIPEIDRGLFPSDKPNPDPADSMPPGESQEELPKSMPPQTFKKKRPKNKSKAKHKK